MIQPAAAHVPDRKLEGEDGREEDARRVERARRGSVLARGERDPEERCAGDQVDQEVVEYRGVIVGAK